eukprot:scaffold346897_cov46-Prasinocladus_malaysianus.AAC.1
MPICHIDDTNKRPQIGGSLPHYIVEKSVNLSSRALSSTGYAKAFDSIEPSNEPADAIKCRIIIETMPQAG